MDDGLGASTQQPRTLRDRINELALDLLRQQPDGVRYSELVKNVMAADSSLNLSTVTGTSRPWNKRSQERCTSQAEGSFRFSDQPMAWDGSVLTRNLRIEKTRGPKVAYRKQSRTQFLFIHPHLPRLGCPIIPGTGLVNWSRQRSVSS